MARRASLKNTIQQQHVLHDHAGRVRQGVLARARGRCVQVARHPCALTSDRAQLPIIGPTSAVAAAPGYLPHSVAQIRRAASGIPPRTMPARAADDTWRGSRHAAHKPRIRIGQKPVSAPHPTASAVPAPRARENRHRGADSVFPRSWRVGPTWRAACAAALGRARYSQWARACEAGSGGSWAARLRR